MYCSVNCQLGGWLVLIGRRMEGKQSTKPKRQMRSLDCYIIPLSPLRGQREDLIKLTFAYSFLADYSTRPLSPTSIRGQIWQKSKSLLHYWPIVSAVCSISRTCSVRPALYPNPMILVSQRSELRRTPRTKIRVICKFLYSYFKVRCLATTFKNTKQRSAERPGSKDIICQWSWFCQDLHSCQPISSGY